MSSSLADLDDSTGVLLSQFADAAVIVTHLDDVAHREGVELQGEQTAIQIYVIQGTCNYAD